MLRTEPRHDIHGDDTPIVNEVTHRRQKERTATFVAAALDDNVWPNFVDDFLIHPEIERAFLSGDAQPEGVAPPRPVELVVVEAVEVINNRAFQDSGPVPSCRPMRLFWLLYRTRPRRPFGIGGR